jgi:hypothetical protein
MSGHDLSAIRKQNLERTRRRMLVDDKSTIHNEYLGGTRICDSVIHGEVERPTSYFIFNDVFDDPRYI